MRVTLIRVGSRHERLFWEKAPNRSPDWYPLAVTLQIAKRKADISKLDSDVIVCIFTVDEVTVGRVFLSMFNHLLQLPNP